MKKNLKMFVTCGVLFAAASLMAATETVDGIEWTYVVSGGEVSLGTGDGYYSRAISTDTAGAVTIPSSLGGYPVTHINSYAFRDCSGLTSVMIPSSVTSIGEQAFCGCNGLTSVTIPDGVTSIGCCSFQNCWGLTNVTIGIGVTSIGYDVFYGCSGLKSFSVSEDNLNYCSIKGLLLTKDGKTLVRGVNVDVTIPDGVTRIGEGAFHGCNRLTSITIPGSVTSIGDLAFYYCSGLISFSVSEGNLNYCSVNGLLLTSDGQTLVCGVNGDVTIPNGVTSIGEAAFSGHSGLTDVTIPNSVTNIGNSAFSGCNGLTSVAIPVGVTRVGDRAFDSCSGLTSVAISDSVTSVGDWAFQFCISLTNITIPSSVTRIGNGVFNGCRGLTNVTLSANVTSIGTSVFSGCNNLHRLDIPHSFFERNYTWEAFLGCPSCMEIHQYDSNGEVTNTWSSITINDTVQSHWHDMGWNTPCFTMSTGDEIYYDVFCYGDRYSPAEYFSLCAESGEQLEFGVDWILLPLDEAWLNAAGFMRLPAGYYRFLIVGIGAYVGTYYFDIRIDKSECQAGTWPINMSFNGHDVYSGDGADWRNDGPYYYFSNGSYYHCDHDVYGYYGNYGSNDTVVASSSMYMGAPQLEMNVNYYNGDGYNISYGTASDGGSSEDNIYTATVTFLNAGRYDVSTSVPSWSGEDEYYRYYYSGSGSCTIVIIRPRPIEELNVSLSDISRTVVYTGEEIRPNFEWEVDDKTSFAYECFSVTNAGTYQIALGAEMDENGSFYNPDWMSENQWYSTYDIYDGYCYAANYTGVTYVAYTVLPRPVVKDQAVFNLHELHCDGTPQTCSIVITNDYNGAVLVEGRDYDVAYSNNILAGTATATVTCKCNYTGTFSQEFEILPSTNVVVVLGLDKKWTTGGNAEWFAEWFEAAHDGVSCMRSGAIGDNQESWIETVVTNTGVVSFWWKASSEAYRGIAYDMAVFSVDGVDVASIGGDVDWTNVTYTVEGNGPHALRWTYRKDDSDNGGQDCAWLDEVQYLREVRVTFEDGGATGGSVPAAMTIGEGLGITLPDQGSLTWPKHRFSGWRINDDIFAPGTPYTLCYDDVLFTAAWEEKKVSAPTIEVAAWYDTERTAVTMGCETVGAVIHYTLDGSTPTAESPVCTGSFHLAGSATIKAIAVLNDYFDSDVVSAESVRAPWTPGECLNVPSFTFSIGGDATWFRDRTVTHDSDMAMRSGAIGDGQTSWIETSVSGAGTLTFWWKVSSEAYKGSIYDYARFTVDGDTAIPDIGGEIDWRCETVTITGSGVHTLRWAYVKDSQDKNGSDCAWLDEVTWTSVAMRDPIPPVVSDDEVAAALAGTTDASLVANVTNAAQYAAYRDWALSVTNGTTTALMIKESTRTWLSFALGADALIGKELTSDDVKIESFTPASSDGKFEFTVSVKDVNIGGGSVAAETLKENLKKVLGIEGAATLSPGAFSSDNIDITFDTPVDGKARFTVTPPADAGNSFFMRVRVK